MKRSIVAMAVLFGASLLGCGGADAEVLPEDFGTATDALCAAGTPHCDDLDLTYCGKRGLTTSCCFGTNTYSCFCTSAGWACP
ncbi:hypothetical protein [Pyxidicoccus trucidator]|uniref:hypothetical protein n=1 Tax=Pyxidicoccus trucidator TaxID=2709662 RepID=UPI0013DB601A|nr:hypothetical protein [Pyxidicoccus trucidator]